MRVKPNGLSFVYSVSGIYVMIMDLTPHGFPDLLPHLPAHIQGLGSNLKPVNAVMH